MTCRDPPFLYPAPETWLSTCILSCHSSSLLFTILDDILFQFNNTCVLFVQLVSCCVSVIGPLTHLFLLFSCHKELQVSLRAGELLRDAVLCSLSVLSQIKSAVVLLDLKSLWL